MNASPSAPPSAPPRDPKISDSATDAPPLLVDSAPVAPSPLAPSPLTPASLTPSPLAPSPLAPSPLTPAPSPLTPAPSPLTPAPSPSASAPLSPASRAHKGRSWMLSLTGVCFIFGALVAMQLRATQQMRDNRIKEQRGTVAASALASEMKTKAEAAARERSVMEAKVARLTVDLKKNGTLSAGQVATLNGQIKELQTVAGLTMVTGPGVRITLSDNPAVAGGDPSSIMPGLVHDYDLQQVVNELRSAKAEAIAIYGAGGEPVRVTGYTPIRCVGPVIMVNWEGVAAPFTIEAIGNSKTLTSALLMSGGIVDTLRDSATIGVKVDKVDEMQLPAATGGVPKMRVAKTAATAAEQTVASDEAKKIAPQ